MVRLEGVFWALAVFFLPLVFLTGCESQSFLDPTQIGRFRSTPAVNIILDSLGVAEEEPASNIIAVEKTKTLPSGSSGDIHFVSPGKGKPVAYLVIAVGGLPVNTLCYSLIKLFPVFRLLTAERYSGGDD